MAKISVSAISDYEVRRALTVYLNGGKPTLHAINNYTTRRVLQALTKAVGPVPDVDSIADYETKRVIKHILNQENR